MPPLSKGLLMLCGSVNPITRAQLLEADRAGYAHIHLEPEEKLTEGFFETEAGLARIRQFQETLARNPFLIIDANDEAEDNGPTRAYAQARGLSTDDLRVLISGALLLGGTVRIGTTDSISELFLEESFLCYLIFDPDTAAGIRVSFSMFVYFASAFCSRLASLDV